MVASRETKAARPSSNLLRRPEAAIILILAVSLLPALRGGLGAQVILSEVLYEPAGVDTGQQVVEIRNLGVDPVEIGGWWLSFKPGEWRFPSPLTLDPLGTILVHLSRSGTSGTTDLYTGLSGMRNLEQEDSIALFSTNLFSDPTFMVDFVQWGTAGQDMESVAVEKGIWTEGTVVDTVLLREGSSIARLPEGIGASAWCVDGSTSLGTANDGCSRSQAKSPVRLNEVIPGPGGGIELWNAGNVIEDLEGKWLLGRLSSAFRFRAGTVLMPGAFLIVRFEAGTDRPGEVFAGPNLLELEEIDSIAFSAGSQGGDSSTLIDFVQWGANGSVNEPQAVEAGIWQAEAFISTDDLVFGGAIASIQEGSGKERWGIDNTPTLGKPNSTTIETPVIINEIVAATGEGEWPAVEIKNVSGSPVDSGRLWIGVSTPADGTIGSPVPAGATIEPGDYLVIRLGGALVAGTDDLVIEAFPRLDPSGGELAILIGPSTANSNNFLNYARWGTGVSAMEVHAVAAGIWPGGAIDIAGMVPGTSIAFQGSGRGPESFLIDRYPSLGWGNLEKSFIRSDCNQDGGIDISDPVGLLSVLFGGATAESCDRACDSNDDGMLDISDPIHVLGFLFLGQGGRKAPIECGLDETKDPLTCVGFRGCSK
jgi:hypothetical protein